MSDGSGNKYTSKPIPPREGFSQAPQERRNTRGQQPRQGAGQQSRFAEIAVEHAARNERTRERGEPVPDRSRYDEIHSVFEKMRALDTGTARLRMKRFTHTEYMRILSEGASAFYKQGMFMRDFTDDYQGAVALDMYCPAYRHLSYGQLRTYFTWRTKVRAGKVVNTSLSYAFLYIYELLNNIGVKSPDDGLLKLIWFWKKFRVHDIAIDKYLPNWIRDYYIAYEPSIPFSELIAGGVPNPIAFKPVLDGFMLYSAISKYNIRRSAFFSHDTAETIERLILFVMDSFYKAVADAGLEPDKVIFGRSAQLSRPVQWKPFAGALYYMPRDKKPRYVVLSEKDVFIFNGAYWTHGGVHNAGRVLVGFIFKLSEAILRERVNYSRKISVSADVLEPKLTELLRKAGISVEKTVKEAAARFFYEESRQVITVDTSALEKIRNDALIIQEKLIVEDSSGAGAAPLEPVKELLQAEPAEVPSADLPSPADDTVRENAGGAPQDSENTQYGDGGEWAEFYASLDRQEREALKIAVSGGSLKPYAASQGIMLEVLVDAINEKAYDVIGDSILEAAESVTVFDDYYEKLAELVMD